MGSIAQSIGPSRDAISAKPSNSAVSPAWYATPSLDENT